MTPTQALERIVDRDTTARIGNGAIPVNRLVTALYEAGRPIPDIEKALELDTHEVCDELGIDRWCQQCGRSCDGKREDFGIGAYEYWGSVGTHTDVRYVSKCCEATVMDADGREVYDEGGPEGDW